ncbi:divalent-cation tolerance protein CutA [Chitinimonas lacunae]|uniref:Divalent-cation tolerance protein CutA n=1 Tax=Chitinimonas lacunae TaxID=1963018 RepID=A0ABV8MXA8_9NEIS
MSQSTEVIVVVCNAPDEATARALASALVERRLAACVNILPAVQSVYRWHGEIEQAGEWPLLIKTTVSRYAEVETLLRERHPYELPEIIALPLTAGLPGYLDWVRTQSGLEGH